MKKEDIKNTFKTIGKGFCYVVGGVGVLIAAAYSAGQEHKAVIDEHEYSYYNAVDAIVKSDLSSWYKQELVETIKRDGESKYYKSVIEIVKSNMSSWYKIDMIKSL